MTKFLAAFLIFSARVFVTMGTPAAGSVAAPNLDAASGNNGYAEEIAKWRADRLKELTSDDGWLTLVGLLWMKQGQNTLGSDPASDLVLPDGKAPGHVGSILLENDKLTITVNPAVTVTSNDRAVKSLELKTDLDGDPTVLTIGSLSFHCIKRGDKYGLRVKDKDSPARAQFQGLDYYPADQTWQLKGKFESYDPAKEIPIVNILGITQDQPSPGAVVFTVNGKTYRLDAIGDATKGLFLMFADATTGRETYGSGRFLDTDAPSKDGTVVVDFNKAYNPPCAFTIFATCPLPPKQNRLPFAVTAGEKKYAGSHH